MRDRTKEAKVSSGGPRFSSDSPPELKASSPRASYTTVHWNWRREGSIRQLLPMGQACWHIDSDFRSQASEAQRG